MSELMVHEEERATWPNKMRNAVKPYTFLVVCEEIIFISWVLGENS